MEHQVESNLELFVNSVVFRMFLFVTVTNIWFSLQHGPNTGLSF